MNQKNLLATVQPKIKKKVRLSLDVSPELNKMLEGLVDKTGSSKSDVLRKAIGFMDIVVDTQQQGLRIGITNDIEKPIQRELLIL